jgi:FKBP-type peptidyl-prolyl cis-trans isomerase FkpA/FKBP-type peptidyl-prolyl cis-trans isomerase FklB
MMKRILGFVAAAAIAVTASASAIARDETNWAKMQSFLTANKAKQGVTVQPSGVQWRYIKKGPGKGGKPSEDATVTVRYKGTLIDGTVFDQTDPNQPPAVFGLKGLIKGWQEVIPMMSRGDKVEIVLPSDLAYGARGSHDGSIKPDQVLVFEIELLDFL